MWSSFASARSVQRLTRLGRFDKVGDRITGDRTQRARNIGWEHVFVAVDDHSRVAFTQIHPDENKHSAEAFLRSAVGYFERLGARVQRVLTDNGKAFTSTTGTACITVSNSSRLCHVSRLLERSC